MYADWYLINMIFGVIKILDKIYGVRLTITQTIFGVIEVIDEIYNEARKMHTGVVFANSPRSIDNLFFFPIPAYKIIPPTPGFAFACVYSISLCIYSVSSLALAFPAS